MAEKTSDLDNGCGLNTEFLKLKAGETRRKLARRVKDSIVNHLTETGVLEDHPRSLYFDIHHLGEAVLWQFGDMSGRVHVIGDCKGSEVLLGFENVVYGDSSSKRYLPEFLRLAIAIQEGIGEYLEKYGRCFSEQHNGEKSYSLKKIP